MTQERARRPLLRLFPVLLLNLTAFAISIPILPALCEALGGGGLEVGALFALQALGQLLMAPIWGKLSDRLGRKPILMVTIIGAALADVWTSFADAMWLLFLARLFAGLFAGNVATASALIADATSLEERSKGMAVVGICFGLGFTIGPGVGALASHLAPDHLGPLGRGFPFLVAAGLNVIVAALGGLLLIEASTDHDARARRRAQRRPGSVRALLRRRPIAQMSVFFLMYSLTVTILETTFYLYMAHRYGYTEAEVGGLFAAMGLLAAAVQGNVGRIAASLGDRRMTLLGAGMLALGLGLSTSYERLWFLITWLGVAAAGRALLQPGGMALISSHARDAMETGKVMGLMQSAQSLGRIIGPVVGGLFFDWIAPRAPFVGAACIMLVAALWWGTTYKPQSRMTSGSDATI